MRDFSLTEHDIDRWRTTRLAEQSALKAEEAATHKDRGTVTLDQQSVGRLSRMDALQRQSMAQATQRRRSARIVRIQAALARMDEGEFGFCLDCGDDIEPARLALDPTTPNCMPCAGRQAN